MKKSLILLSAIAMFGLVACGGKTEDSKTAGDTSENVTPTTSETKTSETPVEVPSIYEHQFVYLSPGKAYDAETETEGAENTLVEQVFTNGKHGGPNYMVAINLLKEDNKCEIARYTMYYSGLCVGKAAFSVEGATWEKNTDGTYKVNVPATSIGGAENAACELTSTADGKLTYSFDQLQKGQTEAKHYDLTLWTNNPFQGEYTGSYTNQEGEVNPVDSLEVTAVGDGTYTVKGAIEDTGISALEGTISKLGIFTGKTPRLDGTMDGLFYTDCDGKTKMFARMEARERHSTVSMTQLAA